MNRDLSRLLKLSGIVAEDTRSRGEALGDLCEVKTNFPDADFWIQRKGSAATVGAPTRAYSPEHIGIRVKDHGLIDPSYLFYWFEFIKSRGVFAQIATGSLKLVHIKASDIARLPVAFR